MKRFFTTGEKHTFSQNRAMVLNTLKSIEQNFFVRSYSYLDEIVNPDNSTNNEKAHAFAKRLVDGIQDEICGHQRDMYESFLYCAFICMERNLLPSFENVVALARNTEIYWLNKQKITPEILAKDKFLPRFGLSGIICRLSATMNGEWLPEEEYVVGEPNYYDFCKRFGYGTFCRAVGQDYSISEENSDEIFERYRDEWDAAIAMTIPDEQDFFASYRYFLDLFYERRRWFKAEDIRKMFDIYLFTEGKSVLATTDSRLNKLISDLHDIDSDILDERDLLECAEDAEDITTLKNSLSVFDMLKKQDTWINDSTRYINEMLNGMNINYHSLITGSTLEETDTRIRRLIGLITEKGIKKTWDISDEEEEMLYCFFYCALWEGLTIHGKSGNSKTTFGELIHRADMAVHFYRYSNLPLGTDLLGGITRAVKRTVPDDTEVHFEHDDDANEKFDAELFDKNEYIARANRLRDILRAQSENNPPLPSLDHNSYLYDFQSLISTAIKSFLYSSGLTAFSFGNDFENISVDIRTAIRKIEKVSNRMRFLALQRTYKAISNSDAE